MRRPRGSDRARGAAAGGVAAWGILAVAGSIAVASPNTCEQCHSDPDFLVQNKKLYDYYQEWNASVHRQEDVTCDDCHGGDPSSIDKDVAHGQGVGASDPSSRIYYRNVPETCGTCHSDILSGYRESHHYQHLVKTGSADQGPTCVTCHGSTNTSVLDVNSVGDACARCHNEKTRNHPEIPERAHEVLNRFLSIHRFYRYIGIHAEAEEARAFFAELDPQVQQLSVTWHTFILDEIDEGTREVLDMMRAKRDEIRARRQDSQ